MPSTYRKWARCGPCIHYIEAADASNCCRIPYLQWVLATSNATDDPEIKEITTMDHPHACLNGYIHLLYTAIDEETGEEVERIEALLCRRCASEAGR